MDHTRPLRSILPLVAVVRTMDAVVALVEPAKEHGPEVHAPEPILDLLEPDLLLGECTAHVHPAVMPAHAAVPAHVADLEMRRVLGIAKA